MIYFIVLLGFLSQSVHTEVEPNSFLDWAKQYAQDGRQERGWVCGLRPASLTSGFPWWVSPLQGSDWSSLQGYIREAQAASELLRTATHSDVSQWPIHSNLDHEGHGISFSKKVTDAVIEKFLQSFLPENRNFPWARSSIHRYKDGYFQIWDEQLWLTPTVGRLSQAAPICWEQRTPAHSVWPKPSKFMGWIPSEQCQYTIVLEASDWFATDWASRPDVRWAAPNGTQWLCGINVWPWLPPGWVGRCTLGFPWMPARWLKALDPSMLEYHGSGILSFKLNDPSSHSVHSVAVRDITWQAESLARYLDKALNDTTEKISLPNIEVQLLRKAELQQQLALDSLTAAKRGSCAVLPGECCVYIPKRVNVEQGSPSMTSFAGSIFSFLSNVSIWKWAGFISVVALILMVILFGSFVMECHVNFRSVILECDYDIMFRYQADPDEIDGPPELPFPQGLEGYPPALFPFFIPPNQPEAAE